MTHSTSENRLFERLGTMARNLWWTWNPEAQDIFEELAPQLWRDSNHNAVDVMLGVSDDEVRARLYDDAFAERVRSVLSEFDQYMGETNTWASSQSRVLKDPVAYFSLEFGLHESLPVYSGGLGILAGDHIKSASDLGIPFVGIGLFYREGYFTQRVGQDGWQQELYVPNHSECLPMTLVEMPEGGRRLNSVQIGHSTVFFQAWTIRVGRATLYLLDTGIPENDFHFQGLTNHVYGGNVDTRIGQEILLGIGGVRLLESIGITPSVFHMNEGHAAFLTFELLARERRNGASKEDSMGNVRARCLFTTHTPVPAGHDRFSNDLMYHTFEPSWNGDGVSVEDMLALGKANPSDSNEPFTMTILALRMSHAANGVSKLHGKVSRRMWNYLYPDTAEDDVPIGSVTNGVHTPSWAIGQAHEFWNKRLGFDWTDKLMEPAFWQRLVGEDLASDEELWALRYTLRRNLVEFVRRRFREHNLRTAGDETVRRILSPDALTIGFARRFATYKRAPLLFRDFDRALALLTDPERPVQIIYSGKAHPRDDEGKKFIQRIVELSHHPQLYGKVMFLENYDINVARHLVSGCDVWLNNPRRPLEASGTSGMKAVIHGGLNVSILDGWWREAFDGSNGWAIGDDTNDPDPDKQDATDAENLIHVLSEQIIPDFFDRDEKGIPRSWMKRIRQAMGSLVSQFNTDRMVAEYLRRFYTASGDKQAS